MRGQGVSAPLQVLRRAGGLRSAGQESGSLRVFSETGAVEARPFVATGIVLAVMYNDFVLASFNPSLALSRKVRVRLCNFTFIVLLALIVNLSLHTVGALLINAMLVVPAATAANLSRNMRQLFWCTVGLCLFVGIAGQWLSWSITLVDAAAGGGKSLNLGGGGIMVVLSVLLFFLSMIIGPRLRRR